jgi:hypothetical protein
VFPLFLTAVGGMLGLLSLATSIPVLALAGAVYLLGGSPRCRRDDLPVTLRRSRAAGRSGAIHSTTL